MRQNLGLCRVPVRKFLNVRHSSSSRFRQLPINATFSRTPDNSFVGRMLLLLLSEDAASALLAADVPGGATSNDHSRSRGGPRRRRLLVVRGQVRRQGDGGNLNQGQGDGAVAARRGGEQGHPQPLRPERAALRRGRRDRCAAQVVPCVSSLAS